ncbi:TonB-dependent vitamin B12 receptor [Dickeya fangzhongdai]|uniref:TonB-dependent vitamin B12 receptor BtuB n=1 Tax=Dickeya fangzhongdai TaxID=1778540 RepID=UPI000EB56F64|nr:TonB-dependent vitamin B12 receptor BtuB [Dickeya fangzhongdai]AYH50412.1 TonB-dependent vitamin B12 receptor [Dickeya fangzhongdai]WES89989.1 TonB-dependent vitamin B12 receptor BtuB [Dickeya fangzhongdai]
MFTKKTTMLAAMVATAFSGWAQGSDNTQQNSNDAMVVTANRFPQPISSVLAPTTVVTRDDIDRWQSKNVLEVIKRLPGVDIAQNGGLGQSASIYIRGSEARHTLVLIDGVPLAKPGITGVADFNQIPMSLVQRIEFIRGPRSAVYGADAIGGVINIITQSDKNGGTLETGIGSNHYQQYNGSWRQALTDKTTLTLAGAYQDTKGFNIRPASVYSPDSDRDGWRNKSFWGGVDHHFNEQWSAFIRGYGYGSNSDYDVGGPNSADEQQIYNHTYDTGVRFMRGDFASQLIASYQKYNFLNYLGTEGRYGDASSLDKMEQRNLQWGNTYRIGQGMLSAGLDWQQQKLFSEGVNFNTAVRESNDYKRDNTGIYLTAQQQISSVTIEGSLRSDDNEQFGRHGTWQTAAGWEFLPDYKLTLSYGTGFQAPTLGQMFGQKYNDILPNKNLKPEESKQWETGIEGITGPLNWRLSAYRNEITNLITYSSDPVTFQGTYSNIKAATLKGVEWTGQFDTGIFNHQITLGYLDARRDEDHEVLARRAKQQAKYQLGWKVYDLDVDVSYQYFSKRYDNNNTNEFASTQRQLPSYSTVDIAASYPVTSHLTVRGRIANLFDKNYETAYGYRTAGREYYLTGSYSF